MKTLLAVLLLASSVYAYDDAAERAADAAERSADAAEDLATYQLYAMASCSFKHVKNPDGTPVTATLSDGEAYPVYVRVCNGRVSR